MLMVRSDHPESSLTAAGTPEGPPPAAMMGARRDVERPAIHGRQARVN